MRDYLIRAAAWLSQGINCLLLGGHHDQTVSARAYVNRDRQPWRVVYQGLNALFFWDEDHCKSSYESEVLRKHLPNHYTEAQA